MAEEKTKNVETRQTFGRTQLFTNVTAITRENVVQVLNDILPTFEVNRGDIIYLQDYKRGKQPILDRVKEVRPEINNKVVENRAMEIVDFKVGYFLNEPIQYIQRGNGDKGNAVTQLNTYMSLENKETVDMQIATDLSTCGVGYRFIRPRESNDEDDAPFELLRLKPESTFVVYSTSLSEEPVMAGVVDSIAVPVMNTTTNTNTITTYTRYQVYTKDKFFTIYNNAVQSEEPHVLKRVPIVEYLNNMDRMGDFEKVITLLDAINKVESNRIDGVEQFVQALLVLKNVDIDTKDFKELQALGCIKIKQNGVYEVDAKFLTQELNQQQVQILVDHMYKCVQSIVGMPNRNGGSSTSDTGSAVIMRDGWAEAESRAQSTEKLWRKSEMIILRIAIMALNTMKKIDLSILDVDIKFLRKNYENMNQKTTVLTTMLGNEKIDPKYAYEYCNIFADPNQAYKDGMAYYEKQRNKTNGGNNSGRDKDITPSEDDSQEG